MLCETGRAAGSVSGEAEVRAAGTVCGDTVDQARAAGRQASAAGGNASEMFPRCIPIGICAYMLCGERETGKRILERRGKRGFGSRLRWD